MESETEQKMGGRSQKTQDLRARLLRGEPSRSGEAPASTSPSPSPRNRFEERSWREGELPGVAGVLGDGDGAAERAADARV